MRFMIIAKATCDTAAGGGRLAEMASYHEALGVGTDS